jgi:hypothetical protein
MCPMHQPAVLTFGSHNATTLPAPKATTPVLGSAEETELNLLAPTEIYSVSIVGLIANDQNCDDLLAVPFERKPGKRSW